LKSYKTRLGLLQEADAAGHGTGITEWLSQHSTILDNIRLTGRVQMAAQHLEGLLVHTGAIAVQPARTPGPTQSSADLRISADTMMTVDEAADLLDLNRNTLYDAIKRDEIPGARRIGRTIRIHRPTLMDWLKGSA
jgi:excisionase family DNA binding protein